MYGKYMNVQEKHEKKKWIVEIKCLERLNKTEKDTLQWI